LWSETYATILSLEASQLALEPFDQSPARALGTLLNTCPLYWRKEEVAAQVCAIACSLDDSRERDAALSFLIARCIEGDQLELAEEFADAIEQPENQVLALCEVASLRFPALSSNGRGPDPSGPGRRRRLALLFFHESVGYTLSSRKRLSVCSLESRNGKRQKHKRACWMLKEGNLTITLTS
jgi:hypothetical protein